MKTKTQAQLNPGKGSWVRCADGKTRWMPITNPVQFSFRKTSEGGMSMTTALFLLHDTGIPARRCPEGSAFIGHQLLEVPQKFERRTARILFS